MVFSPIDMDSARKSAFKLDKYNCQVWRWLLKTNKDQRAKKVVSDSPGLVDFAIRLVIFVLNLPDGQVLFFGEIQIPEGL